MLQLHPRRCTIAARVLLACLFAAPTQTQDLFLWEDVGSMEFPDYTSVPGGGYTPGLTSDEYSYAGADWDGEMSMGRVVAPRVNTSKFDFSDTDWNKAGVADEDVGMSLVPPPDSNVTADPSFQSVDVAGDAIGTHAAIHAATVSDLPAVREDARRDADGLTPGAKLSEQGPGTDPIDPGSGAFAETWTDAAVQGSGVDFELRRTYSSRTAFRGVLGVGWDLSYHERVVVDDGCDRTAILWATGRGYSERLIARTHSTYAGRDGTGIRASSTGTGWSIDDSSGLTRTFDQNGKLQRIYDQNGNGLDITWSVRQDGVDVVAEVVDSFGRTFAFDWVMNGGSERSLTVSGPDTLVVSYAIDSHDDLIVVTDMWGRTTELEYDAGHPVQPHVGTKQLQASCEAACGLREHECVDEPPCRQIMWDEVEVCEDDCSASCAGGCRSECYADCAPGCDAICPTETECEDVCLADAPALAACLQWDKDENGIGPNLIEYCDNQCILHAAGLCAQCVLDNGIFVSVGDSAASTGGATFIQNAQTAIRCSTCVPCLLGGALCPDEMRYSCQSRGQSCRDECINYSLIGRDAVPERCQGYSPSGVCTSTFKYSCDNACEDFAFDCPQTCMQNCEAGCAAPCVASCAEPCREACSPSSLLATCEGACMDACIADGSQLDGMGAPVLTYGATQQLNHNLLRVYLGTGATRKLMLHNTYGQDIYAPDFDRVVSQTFGSSLTTLRYEEMIAPLGEPRDLCPQDEPYCPGGAREVGYERIVRLSDELVAFVRVGPGATLAEHAEYRIDGLGGTIPVITATIEGDLLILEPPVPSGDRVLIRGEASTLLLLPTNVPGVFAGPSGGSMADLPSEITIARTDLGTTGHAGRLLGLAAVLEGRVSAAVTHVEAAPSSYALLTPGALHGPVRLQEVARRWASVDQSQLLHPYGVVELEPDVDGLPTLQVTFPSPDDLFEPEAPLLPADGRNFLAKDPQLQPQSAVDLAQFEAELQAQAQTSTTMIGDLIDAAVVLRGWSGDGAILRAGLDAQARLTGERAGIRTTVTNLLASATTETQAIESSLPSGTPEEEIALELLDALTLAEQVSTHSAYQGACDIVIDATDVLNPYLSGTNLTRLGNIVCTVTAARANSSLATDFAGFERDTDDAAAALDLLRGLRAQSSAAYQSASRWLSPTMRLQAAEADQTLDGYDTGEAHLWALAGIKTLEERWRAVRDAFPPTPDVAGNLRRGAGTPVTWQPPVDNGWWVDDLFGIPDPITDYQNLCLHEGAYRSPEIEKLAQAAVRKTTITDGNGHAWEYYSDSDGRVVRQLDPQGGQIDLNYTEEGHVRGVRGVFGDRHCYEYDPDGNLAADNWFPIEGYYQAAQSVRRSEYWWTEGRRLSAVYLPDPTTGEVESSPAYSYVWDAAGNLDLATTPSGTYDVVSVDGRGRPLEVTGPAGYRAYSTYDSPTAQSVSTTMHTALTDAGGAYPITVTSEADPLGRLVRTTRTGGPTIDYIWLNQKLAAIDRHASGPLAASETAFAYENGDLTKVLYKGANGSTVQEVSREFNARGLLTKQTTTSGSDERVKCFKYDGRHELVEEIDPTGRRTAIVRSPVGAPLKLQRGYWTASNDVPGCPLLGGATSVQTMREQVVGGQTARYRSHETA